MHPLSTFPTLLSFGLLSPFLLRLTVSIFLLIIAKERFGKSFKWIAIFHIALSALIAIGLYTQISSILAFLAIITEYMIDKKQSSLSKEKVGLYTVLLVILISLLFTGPGLFAFDLPL